MFKNALIYRINADWKADMALLEAALAAHPYTECGPSQEKALGWSAPRGEAHGALVEAIDGQYLLKFMAEAKAVPSSVINRKARDALAKIEAVTGRKPGKRETRDVKEEIRHALMPMAFTKLSSVMAWIDPKAYLLILDTSSQAKADELITLLVQELDGFSVSLLNPQTSCAVAMSTWLSSQDPPAGFSIDRECELKSPDETKAVVRYSRHALDIEEVKAHINSGKVPTKLAMTWNGRVSFLLTDLLQIKKIAFLDTVFEGANSPQGEKADGFDADVAIATGELRRLIPDLIAALGGEIPD